MHFETKVHVFNLRASSRWITIMAYPNDCNVGYVNYFSNPNVMLRGKPTGTATANCAEGIIAHMVRLAQAHEGAVSSPKLSMSGVAFGVFTSPIVLMHEFLRREVKTN